MVHVASSWRLHEDEAEDRRIGAISYIRLCYSNFIILLY
jgi:hypothetical protein